MGKQPEAPDASLRVLVVEEDPVLADLFATLMQHDGHSVTLIQKYRSPLDLAGRAGEFDIAFLDPNQTEGRWRPMVDALATSDPDLPIVLVSGWAESLAQEELETLRVKAVLSKPFGTVELRRVMAAVYGPIWLARRKNEATVGEV